MNYKKIFILICLIICLISCKCPLSQGSNKQWKGEEKNQSENKEHYIITRYLIISSSNLEQLQIDVNNKIGIVSFYEPLGAPFYHNGSYHQAMRLVK